MALTAFHGRTGVAKDSMQGEGLGDLEVYFGVADQTAIRHALLFPEGSVAFPAIVPYLCVG
jgi:hypothetical protein